MGLEMWVAGVRGIGMQNYRAGDICCRGTGC